MLGRAHKWQPVRELVRGPGENQDSYDSCMLKAHSHDCSSTYGDTIYSTIIHILVLHLAYIPLDEYSHAIVLGSRADPRAWTAQYYTWLLSRLTPKGVLFLCAIPFFSAGQTDTAIMTQQNSWHDLQLLTSTLLNVCVPGRRCLHWPLS